MRLLRGEVVTASGGQRVGPPVPGGDEQQNGNEDRVRRKEKGYLAVGKTQHPGGSRRQIIASTSWPESGIPCGERTRLLIRPGVSVEFQFAIRLLAALPPSFEPFDLLRVARDCVTANQGDKRREHALPASVDVGGIILRRCSGIREALIPENRRLNWTTIWTNRSCQHRPERLARGRSPRSHLGAATPFCEWVPVGLARHRHKGRLDRYTGGFGRCHPGRQSRDGGLLEDR